MFRSVVDPKFRLSDKFLSEFIDKQPDWGFGGLSYFTYKRTYAREKEDGTNEEFYETLERVVNGAYKEQERHCKNHGLPWNPYKAQKSAQEMFRRMWEFKLLPPGRGLWMMGTTHVETVGSAALNNCFSGNTEIFFTKEKDQSYISKGKLIDLINQDIYVLNMIDDKYVSVPARVKSFGNQKINKITFKPKGLRSNFEMNFEATSSHRWILNDGSSTTSLKIGDTVTITPESIALNKNEEDVGFAHGLIYGDGTRHTYYPDRHFIRLCGSKEQKHISRLEKISGYISTTYPKSYNGDAVITIKRSENWKALPSLEASKSYLKGFIDGWIAADAHTNSSGSITLDTSNFDAARWVSEIAPLVGFVVTGWNVENSPTNFGPRTFPLQRISLTTKPVNFIVKSIIDEGKEEEVFCPEVPNYNQFTLVGGLITGNCGFVSTADFAVELAAPFTWSMDMLMLGVGIGFDTKGAGKVKIKVPTGEKEIFVISDDREGWVESLRKLINSYQSGNTPVEFDYSLIRKAGLPIKGFGGTSSGPAPLMEMHVSIRKLLNPLDGQMITSVAITDMMNFIGKCVVAGNVRRSAELAIGDIDDQAYVEMKDYNLHSEELYDRRWASNNSVFVNQNTDFKKIQQGIVLNGEPGLIFLDNARHYGRTKDGYLDDDHPLFDNCAGFNPCAEQPLESYELCCLVESFPSRHETAEDFLRTLKFAYLYAKSVSLIHTHDERTNSVMMRNRRIGTSQSGIQQAMNKFGRTAYLRDFCDAGYNYIKKLDRTYSRWLGIPESIRKTTVKPSGTVSLLAGVWPGIHFTHSQDYFRTVRLASNSEYLPALLDANFKIEYSVNDWSKIQIVSPISLSDEEAKEFCLTTKVEAGDLLEGFTALGGTLVVYFPVQETNFTKSKFDVTVWEQLIAVREMQHYWADNAVSCTVTVKEEEQKDIVSAIEYMAPYAKSLSFLPLTNHRYDQAPYIESTKEEIDTYSQSLKSLDLSKISKQKVAGSKFCDSDACSIE